LTLRQHFADLACPVDPGRALVKVGLSRKHADRLLATPFPSPPDASIRRLAELLAEQAHGGLARTAEEARALALELLVEPERVRVQLEGPSWLDPGLWLPGGDTVTPGEARRVHHLLHGRHVGGQRVQVLLDPPLRLGRRRPVREDRRTRRRRLFSRWHEGVQWDEEGLWSATPEALADELVAGLSGVVVDAGCGLGSLALALARLPDVEHVIAIDHHPERLAMARHNARIYGVEASITFVRGDVTRELPTADALVADPPWGGRNYPRDRISVDELGLDLAALLERAPPTVRLKLPPSFVTASLPGAWSWRPAVDVRGTLKFLVARRGG